MTKARAIKIFGNQAELAKFLKLTQQAVSNWSDEAIPPLREYQLKEYLKKQKELKNG